MVEVMQAYEPASWSSRSGGTAYVAETVAEPRTVDELLRIRATQLPHAPLVSYPHHGLDYVDYTARQLDQYACFVAKRYASYLPPRTCSSEKAQVVGLLGLSSLDYLVTAMAIQKLGHTALHLSTRISHEAYINLLEQTKTVMVLVDDTMQNTVLKCKAEMPTIKVQSIMLASEYIQPIQAHLDTNLTPDLDPNTELDTVAWIIHSSGSTGLPKPIYQTQRAAINNYKGNMNMRGFITLPLFHSHGISSTYRAIYSGKQIHIFNARIPLTKQYLMEVMQQFDFEIFYGVPYVLNLLAEDKEGIRLLTKCKIVMFGGSACPDELGEVLVQSGVNLVSHWGSTETGQLMTSFRPVGDKAWNYLRPSETVKPYLQMEYRGEGLFEAVCLAGWPSKVATNRPDGSYAMKDLFTKHPEHDWWKYYGRLDDTIVLVNGEKAMPLPVEGAARQHPWVSEAVVFGKGRDQLGLAVIRAPGTITVNSRKLAQEVISSIEKTQSEMPMYARISTDMVLVFDENADYPHTDKGTVIRMKFYKRFENEINALYESANSQKGTLQLSEDELRVFIRTTLETLSPDLVLHNDDQDFFNAGMDSLQATRLRTALVRDIDTGNKQLGINIAFEHPTIAKLAHYLYALRTGLFEEDKIVTVEDEMQQLIEKYNKFQPHVPQRRTSTANSIILTGVTGSLGAHMASILANNSSITKVHCLIRASSAEQAQQRLSKSMADRGVPLSPSTRSKLIALPSTLAKPDLGLDSTTLTTLRAETTAIIHSAWSVNFNLNLSSFEDCIQGTHNLMQLALSTTTPTPASFNFCSSVSTVMRAPTTHITETIPALSHAQGMGYAQSKLATEHLCSQTTQSYNLPTHVLRIGQIIGDTRSGTWNKQEAIPTMMQSATTIGALPTLDENVRWLPVDVVAQSCVDIATQTTPATATCSVYNVLNPQTLHWTRDLLPLLSAQGLKFDALPVREWLARLQSSNPDPSVNAPVKLLDFWMGKYGDAKQVAVVEKKKVEYTWQTSNTATASPILSIVDKESVLDVVRLSLTYFRKNCW